MALTYPIAMPSQGFAQDYFELLRFDYGAPEDNGRIGGITGAPPKWEAEWTLSKTLTIDWSDELRAWHAGLRGMQRLFFGRDLERPFPKAYRAGFAGMTRAGGGSFTGAATAWSQTIAANGDADIQLQGLPASFVLGKGDYIGLRWTNAAMPGGTDNRRALARVTTGSTANGSGVAAVTVEPPLDMRVVPGGAVAYLDNPVCLMKLRADKTQLAPKDRLGIMRGGTISAMQVMLP
ncbi:MAG: hypothetical protein C0494_16900 [Sphingobium sp.]|nr:hypothetical protein [Sphingobium sp.]